MRKPVALFDIDNTIYKGFSYFALLEAQAAEGLIAPQVCLDAQAIMRKYQSKVQDYETTIVELLDIYAAGLKNQTYDAVLESTKRFYRHSDQFFPYVRPTMSVLRGTHTIALVTGEPQCVAAAVADLFDLEAYCSTQYEVQDGLFTGKTAGDLATRHEKHAAIQQLMEQHGMKGSFAFGDSEGDIEMLRAVEHPICVNGTPGLLAVAQKEGWHLPDTQAVTALVTTLRG